MGEDKEFSRWRKRGDGLASESLPMLRSRKQQPSDLALERTLSAHGIPEKKGVRTGQGECGGGEQSG